MRVKCEQRNLEAQRAEVTVLLIMKAPVWLCELHSLAGAFF